MGILLQSQHANERQKLSSERLHPSFTEIVHIITTIMRGGAENQLLVLVSEQVKNGQKVDVIFLKGEFELAAEFEECGATVHTQFSKQHPLLQILSIRKFLSGLKFEDAIVHAHLPRAQITAAFAVTKSQRLICSRHDEDQFYPNRNRLFSLLVFKVINSRIDAWVAISDAVKLRMISYGENPRVGEIEVVHYGFNKTDSEINPILVEKLREQYNLDNDNYVIGCVARLIWQKNHSTLLKAFHAYYLRNPQARLVLVGDGPMRTQLTNQIKELEIFDKVILTGKVSNVREHLEIFNVFVLPSLTEGFGLVLLEAMEANLPIIASNISAIPEVIGQGGLLFQAGDEKDLATKIEKFESFEEREFYSGLSRERLMDFAPEIMYSKLTSTYEKVAQYK